MLDIVLNVLLYVPLGVALMRLGPLRAFGLAAALSFVMELSQIWSIGRFASPYDVLVNSLAALAAAWVARLLHPARITEPISIPVKTWVAVLSGLLATGLFVLCAIPVPRVTLTSWDAEYPLQLGNELTGDRPWVGRIASATLAPRASSVKDGVVSAGPLDIKAGDRVQLPADAARNFASLARASDEFAVMARFTPADVERTGPARIVSFSHDTEHRNFDLGQEREHLAFRIRTSNTGPNGNSPLMVTGDVLKPGREASVIANFDSRVARVFVNGGLQARHNFWAQGCPIRTLCDGDLLLARSVLGASVAVVAIWAVRSRRRKREVLAAVGAGFVAMLISYWLDARSEALQVAPLGPLMVLLGAGVVALALKRPPAGAEPPAPRLH